jgi:dihydroxyacetone kinase-like predicted kinase
LTFITLRAISFGDNITLCIAGDVVLKEVGVVDSGGTGLIYIFQGMLDAVNGKPVARNEEGAQSGENAPVAAGASMESEEFGYCTEFIMRLG